MGWARFDDRWAMHPKLMAAGATPTEVLEAKGLDASAICYSAGQETDGFIADSALVLLAAGHRSPARIAQRLVAVGRWQRDDQRKGYLIHDYLDYNQSRNDAEERRQAERDRKASGRKAQGRDVRGRVTSARNPAGQGDVSAGNLDGSDVTSARNPAGVPPVPTRPDLYPPQAPPAASNGHAPIGNPEMETSTEELPNDPLVDRLAEGLWPGRARMRAETAGVVARCLAVADRSIVDEEIGKMLAVDDVPRSPKYLLASVRTRLVSAGAFTSGAAVNEAMGLPA